MWRWIVRVWLFHELFGGPNNGGSQDDCGLSHYHYGGDDDLFGF